MKLVKIKANEVNNGLIKATIHKTGKLTFSKGASEFMNLNHLKSIEVYIVEGEKNFGDEFYFKISSEGVNKDNFKIYLMGEYYQINFKNLFKLHNVDFVRKVFNYSITKSESGEYYHLIKI